MLNLTFIPRLSIGVVIFAVLAGTVSFGNAAAAENANNVKSTSPATADKAVAPVTQKTTKPVIPVVAAPAPKPAASAQPAALPEPKVYQTDKLINTYIAPNSDFTWWKGNTPEHWTTFGGVRHESTGFDDKHPHSVRLLRGAGIMFALPNNKEVIGGQFRASVEGKASTPDMLAIVLEAKVNGEKRVFTAYHPGDNKWHTIEFRRDITDQFDPGSLVVKLCRKPGVEGDAFVDFFRCRIVKGEEGAKADTSASVKKDQGKTSPAKKEAKKTGSKK